MPFQFKWMGNIYSSKRVRWPDGKAFKTKKEENLALGTHAQAFFSYANFFSQAPRSVMFGLWTWTFTTGNSTLFCHAILYIIWFVQKPKRDSPFPIPDFRLTSVVWIPRLMTTAVLKQPFSIYWLWCFSFSTLTFLVFIKRLWGNLLGELSGNKTLRKSVWVIKYYLV